MNDAKEMELRNFSRKQTFLLNGKPMLSGYSFNCGCEEYMLVKRINATESREEGNYYYMKVIRGTENQVGFEIIRDANLANALWTKIMESFSLDDVLEKLLGCDGTGNSSEIFLSRGIKINCNNCG